jgi:hypothetical protein
VKTVEKDMLSAQALLAYQHHESILKKKTYMLLMGASLTFKG